jgi:hypothetical protein
MLYTKPNKKPNKNQTFKPPPLSKNNHQSNHLSQPRKHRLRQILQRLLQTPSGMLAPHMLLDAFLRLVVIVAKDAQDLTFDLRALGFRNVCELVLSEVGGLFKLFFFFVSHKQTNKQKKNQRG